MANYVGIHCPVCSKRFADGDDVVVCPICGAPHHRECYNEQGHCALNDLHINGHTWQPPENVKRGESETPGEAVCAACGAKNPINGIFCQVCGAPMRRQPDAPMAGGTPGVRAGIHTGGIPFAGGNAGDAYTAAFGGLSPDEQIKGVTARDIALYIGENSRYFLPRFKQLSQGRGISVNFAAFFFNFLYYFYRKMYLAGGILLAVFAIVQIPSFFVAPELARHWLTNIEDIAMGISVPYVPTQNLWAYTVLHYTSYVLYGVGLVFSMFANRIYMRIVLKNVRKLKASLTDAAGSLDDSLYTQALSRKGRTSRTAVVVCLVGIVVVMLSVCFALSTLLYRGMQ